jgi:hypothetical protein
MHFLPKEYYSGSKVACLQVGENEEFSGGREDQVHWALEASPSEIRWDHSVHPITVPTWK